MEISVIIPIYNSEKFLNELFKSIEIQTLNKDKFEVIFIDNNSCDNSANIIRDFIFSYPDYNLKYLFYDKKQSSYAARNFGVKNSKGDILAFTDSDCILEENWLINIYNKLITDTNIIISGNIELIIEDKKNIWENFDKAVHMKNDLRIKKNEVATANMAVNKKDFYEVGYFDEVSSGGDFNWAKTANEKGKEIIFKENIIVYHPTRKTYKEIRKKLYRLTYGEGELYKKENKSFSIGVLKNIARLIYLPKYIKISKKMIKNVGVIKVIKFNLLYFKLKLGQINSFIRGYGDNNE